MPQSCFSVTKKFQYAHIPPSLMDNPYCEGWSACQSKCTAIANSRLLSPSLAEGLSCDLVLGGHITSEQEPKRCVGSEDKKKSAPLKPPPVVFLRLGSLTDKVEPTDAQQHNSDHY
ncbi:uncharacterized [Tachysurus ichikawai]